MHLLFALLLLFAIAIFETSASPEYELLRAAEKGYTDQLIAAIGKGALLDTRNNNGVSALIWGANNGHLEIVQEMLKRGISTEDRSNNGRTPLIWAALWGHTHIVEHLISHGANVSAIDLDGMTPLMSAVLNGHSRVVEILLKSDSHPTAKNFHEGTALTIARIKGFVDIEMMLEPHFPEELSSNPYILACQQLRKLMQWLYLRSLRKAQFHLGLRDTDSFEDEL